MPERDSVIQETHSLFGKAFKKIKAGTSILLVEQNARMALEIAHGGYVFKNGNIFLEDTGNNLLKNDQVEKLFLGG
jgi:branched-chain amino acid transport system ATP-binding protein